VATGSKVSMPVASMVKFVLSFFMKLNGITVSSENSGRVLVLNFSSPATD